MANWTKLYCSSTVFERQRRNGSEKAIQELQGSHLSSAREVFEINSCHAVYLAIFPAVTANYSLQTIQSALSDYKYLNGWQYNITSPLAQICLVYGTRYIFCALYIISQLSKLNFSDSSIQIAKKLKVHLKYTFRNLLYKLNYLLLQS